MPTIRAGLPTSVVDGKIYAIGGDMKERGKMRTWGAIVQVYDPKTDTWSQAEDMPTPRGDLSSSAVNGKIYAIGGQGGKEKHVDSLPTVEEYDPGFREFQSVNPARKLATMWGQLKAEAWLTPAQ